MTRTVSMVIRPPLSICSISGRTASREYTARGGRGVKAPPPSGSRGDQVAVVSGVKPGDEVVTSGVFKLRNGAAVVVNNEVQPENNPAPTPEES